MSSVSYQQHHLQRTSSPSASSTASYSHPPGRPAFFPASYEPDPAHSAFQINPLSSHPPRTPRPSIVGSSHTPHLPDIYNTSTEEHQEKEHLFDEQMPTMKQEENASEASSYAAGRNEIRKSDVWKELLASSNGRDKALKLVQYSMKFFVLFHRTMAGDLTMRFRKPRAPSAIELELLKRLNSGMAGISLARKCMLLFNWLGPLNVITRPETLPYTNIVPVKQASKPWLYPFLQAPPPVLLDLVNGIAEDISTSAKLGLIKGKLGQRAGRLADWTWFAGTLVALVELSMERSLVRNLMQEVESKLYAESVDYANATINKAGQEIDERELKRLKEQLYWIRATRIKLLMDLIFVTYDCFRIEKAKDPVKTIAGLASACLSSAKLYNRQLTSLSKKGLP